jgi:Rieske Fe-S protein
MSPISQPEKGKTEMAKRKLATVDDEAVSRSLLDLRPGEGAVVDIDGEPVAAYLHDDGATYLLSARCQHAGCTVDWNGEARTWDCPCHGSRYRYDGAIINGPTTRPLPPVEV